MKRLYLFFSSIVLIMALTFSCERDDICAESTPTTPRLLIEFYDITNPEDLKSVTRLTVYGENLVTDPTEASNATLVFNENVNAVELPLRIGIENEMTTTRYILEKDTNLRLDENDTTDSNIDILEISYTNEFIYVSRACGYKSIFTELVLTRDVEDINPWISNIVVNEAIDRTVENENTVHVQIFH